MGAPLPCGQCHPWAYREVWEKGGLLVHGRVTAPYSRPPEVYDHAWVERGGKVYDWQTMEAGIGGKFSGRGYPLEVFYELFRPEGVRRYTREQALGALARSRGGRGDGGRHYGPWHGPGSRARVIFPWTLHPGAHPNIFQTPYWTADRLAVHLGESLHRYVGSQRRAADVARRWVNANIDALMDVRDAEALYRLLDRFYEEVSAPMGASSQFRRQEREERQRRERGHRVEAARRRAARYDPGPVTTRVKGRRWAGKGALPAPVYHATLAGRAVMRSGLKSREQLWRQQRTRAQHQGRREAGVAALGGGPSDVVSFTPHEHRAVHIAAIFQALNEALRNPGPVVAWFDAHWRPALVEGWRRLLEADGSDPSDERRWRFVREVDAIREDTLDADWGAIYVKELINRTAQVAGAASHLLDPVFTAPVLMGGRPRAVPPEDVGVVTAYANVDQLLDMEVGVKRRHFLVAGIAARQGGREGDIRVVCPPERGAPRRAAWIGDRTRRRWPWLERAAIATTTLNPYEAEEIRICPQDAAVVGFKPVLDWREVLMPSRRFGSARRAQGAEALEAEIASRWAADNPLMEQRRRCVRAVYLRLEAAELRKRRKRALSREEIDAMVSRAFAICTASLQRGGYLRPGTAEPTPKGVAASLVKLGHRGGARRGAPRIDPARRHAEYEAILESRRMRTLDLEGLFAERGRAHSFQQQRRHRRAGPGAPLDLESLFGSASRGSRYCTTGERRPRSCPLPGSRNVDIEGQLVPLRQAMDEVFTCDTAFGECKEYYPSAGHCMLAAMVVQDLFGGKILFGTVNGVPHYWNRVGQRQVDVTGDQFGGRRRKVRVKTGKLNGGGEPFARHPGEQLRQPFNREVMELHLRFVDRLVPVLRQRGLDEWADVLIARQAA